MFALLFVSFICHIKRCYYANLGTALREWEIRCGNRNGVDCLENWSYIRDSSPEIIDKLFDLYGVAPEDRQDFDVHSVAGNRMFQFMGGETSGNHFFDVEYHHK